MQLDRCETLLLCSTTSITRLLSNCPITTFHVHWPGLCWTSILKALEKCGYVSLPVVRQEQCTWIWSQMWQLCHSFCTSERGPPLAGVLHATLSDDSKTSKSACKIIFSMLSHLEGSFLACKLSGSLTWTLLGTHFQVIDWLDIPKKVIRSARLSHYEFLTVIAEVEAILKTTIVCIIRGFRWSPYSLTYPTSYIQVKTLTTSHVVLLSYWVDRCNFNHDPETFLAMLEEYLDECRGLVFGDYLSMYTYGSTAIW